MFKKTLGWVVGLWCAMLAFFLFSSGSFISGALMILVGALPIPPVFNYIVQQEKIKAAAKGKEAKAPNHAMMSVFAVMASVGLIIFGASSGDDKPVNELAEVTTMTTLPEVAETEWYSGGTLHDASAAMWMLGSGDDQLATAADWTAAYMGQENITSMDYMKIKSLEVVACLNKFYQEQGVDLVEYPPQKSAAVCMALMKYPQKADES